MSDDAKGRSATARRSGRGGQPMANMDRARGGSGGGDGGGNTRASQPSVSRASRSAAGPSARRGALAGTLLKSTLKTIAARSQADKISMQSATSRAQGPGGRSGGSGRSLEAEAQVGTRGRGAGLAMGSRAVGAERAAPSSRGRKGDASEPGAPAAAPSAAASRHEGETMKQASGKPPGNEKYDQQPERAQSPQEEATAGTAVAGVAVAAVVAGARASSTPLRPAVEENRARAKTSAHETPMTGEQAAPPPSPNGAREQAVSTPPPSGAIQRAVSRLPRNSAIQQVISPPPRNAAALRGVCPPSLNGVGVAAPVLEGERAVVEQDGGNGGGVRAGAGWGRRFSRMAKLVVGGMIFAAVAGFVDRCTLPPKCKGNSLEYGSDPLMPGECVEWEGGSRSLLRFLPGVKAKSRLTVKEGGATYSGPDGVEVPIRAVIPESKGGVSGLLCGAELFVREVTGCQNAPFTARIARSQLVFGADTFFCPTHATPAPSIVFDALNRGTARFSDAGHLEVVGRGGKVVWTAAQGVEAPGGRAPKGSRGKPSSRTGNISIGETKQGQASDASSNIGTEEL